ncbi:MAG: hypothetical protein ACE5JN_15205, partial [Candidatus Methylomirabilia bacterium]
PNAVEPLRALRRPALRRPPGTIRRMVAAGFAGQGIPGAQRLQIVGRYLAGSPLISTPGWTEPPSAGVAREGVCPWLLSRPHSLKFIVNRFVYW